MRFETFAINFKVKNKLTTIWLRITLYSCQTHAYIRTRSQLL